MTTDLKRAIALKKFNNEDFFILNSEKAYEVTIESAEEAHKEWEQETENGLSFEEFCEEQLAEVEEIGEYEGDYLICTDDEAQDRFVQCLQDYIDDCIMPTIPESLRYYFDDEKWMRDAEIDGRGHTLASYDGEENEVIVDEETFYIYRIN